MRKLSHLPLFVIIGAFVVLVQTPFFAQRTGYSKEEFMRRRTALMSSCRDGMIILFGDGLPSPGHHFRQENDFFYFTGVEDLNAIVAMTPQTGQSYLFVPQQSARE